MLTMQTLKKTKMFSITFALAAIGCMISMPLIANAMPKNQIPDEGLLPELRAIVPTHLQIQNQHQKDILRFTNQQQRQQQRPQPPQQPHPHQEHHHQQQHQQQE